MHTLLIVDDAPENITLLRNIVAPHFRVVVATSGERALQIIQSEAPPDIVLLDVVMPGIDGYEVCRRVKADPLRADIPVIFVTSMDEQDYEEYGFAIGASDYIAKPFSPAVVLARVRTHLALYDQTRELERRVGLRTRELLDTRLQIIQRLGRASEFRDNETGNHVIRMSLYCKLIAQAAGLSPAATETLYLAAPMHDVGKIGTPDHILLKPGKLNAQEWDIMKNHALAGAEIIGEHTDELLSLARVVAMSHHEKWDGSGYPLGLKGEAIPLPGRIVALADVFDALTSDRPYKRAWSVEDAVQTIQAGAGLHFDPGLIAPFLSALPGMIEIMETYAEPEDYSSSFAPLE